MRRLRAAVATKLRFRRPQHRADARSAISSFAAERGRSAVPSDTRGWNSRRALERSRALGLRLGRAWSHGRRSFWRRASSRPRRLHPAHTPFPFIRPHRTTLALGSVRLGAQPPSRPITLSIPASLRTRAAPCVRVYTFLAQILLQLKKSALRYNPASALPRLRTCPTPFPTT